MGKKVEIKIFRAKEEKPTYWVSGEKEPFFQGLWWRLQTYLPSRACNSRVQPPLEKKSFLPRSPGAYLFVLWLGCWLLFMANYLMIIDIGVTAAVSLMFVTAFLFVVWLAYLVIVFCQYLARKS